MPANRRVLLDTGPLVAILDADDHWHGVCATALVGLPLPLLTTWPVVTEAAWLLRRVHGGLLKLIELFDREIIVCVELDQRFPARAELFAREFADLRPQLADLSLLDVAIQHSIVEILTLDRRDFAVYQHRTQPALRLLPDVVAMPVR